MKVFAQSIAQEVTTATSTSTFQSLMQNKQFLLFAGGAVFLTLVLIIKKATGH